MFISGIFARKPEIDVLKPVINVEQHESFQLMCAILKGTKPIRFEWLRNGHKIVENDQISIDLKATSSILYIDKILVQHSGNYSCRASNSDGTDQSSTILQIKGLFF